MTKEEILAMEAGRILDAQLGEKVMGLDMVEDTLPYLPKHYHPDFDRTIFTDVPKYSTDISDAWKVIDNLSKKGFLICLNSVGENAGGFIRGTSRLGDWHCNVRGLEGEPNHVYETSAPEAICKAALLAVMT